MGGHLLTYSRAFDSPPLNYETAKSPKESPFLPFPITSREPFTPKVVGVRVVGRTRVDLPPGLGCALLRTLSKVSEETDSSVSTLRRGTPPILSLAPLGRRLRIRRHPDHRVGQGPRLYGPKGRRGWHVDA